MTRPYRSTSLICAVVSVSLLIGASAEAQRKKKPAAPPPKKKPAATAPAKPGGTPADQAAPEPAAAEEATEAETAKPKDEEADKAKIKTEEEVPAHTEGAHHLPMFDAAIGLRGFQRHLSYNDDIQGMPTYSLSPGGPAIAGSVEVYPLAGSGGFGGNVGLTGSFDYGFALGSQYDSHPPPGAEGRTFPTKSYGYQIGAKVRFAVGTGELGLGAEYGGQAFLLNLDPPQPGAPGVPDVSYTFVRPNVTGRFPLSEKLSLRAGLGYLFIISAGEIRSRDYFYPDTTKIGAVDGRLGVALALSPDIEGRVELDARRYFYAMAPLVGDPMIVGGALDQYFGLTAAVAYRH